MSFTATKQTTGPYTRRTPQLQVVGNKIHYVFSDNSIDGAQVWTAVTNLDGTAWTANKRSSCTAGIKYYPQMQAANDKIYYVWQEDSDADPIWTAVMNLDGTGWTATQHTKTTWGGLFELQLCVYGDKIYYVWQEYDVNHNYQIWTATANLDGTGWTEIQRTDNNYNSIEPQIQVIGNKIYYVFSGQGQIYTATANLDSTGWTATQRTFSSYSKYDPQLQIVGTKIYYVWREYDGSRYQIWTAVTNLDGTGFTAVKQTTSAYHKYDPQQQVTSSAIYYTWHEYDGSYLQIWTAVMNLAVSKLYHRTATEWKAAKKLSEWDGTQWVEKPAKRWTGTEYKQFT